LETVTLALVGAVVVLSLACLALAGVVAHRSAWSAGRVAGLTYTHTENLVQKLMEERRWAASNSVEAKLADASNQAAMTFAEHADKSAERMLQLTEDGREVLKLRQELKIAETNLENARHSHELALRALSHREFASDEPPPEPSVTTPREGEVHAKFSAGGSTSRNPDV
jgi:hypothetical protein